MSAWPRIARDWRFRLFYRAFTRRGNRLLCLGTAPCSWWIDPSELGAGSVVYSFGAGRDISFELQLSARFGCTVHLFDPSPTGRETVAAAAGRNARLCFEPVGLWTETASVPFALPAGSPDGSYSAAIPAGAPASAEVRLPCRSLADLMAARGHTRIDLLKLDIEGAEYPVLHALLRAPPFVRQICVEVHHWMATPPRPLDTARLVARMWARGYTLVHVNGWDHTFIHRSLSAPR